MADYVRIERCRGCHTPNELVAVLEMSPMPLAGLFCSSSTEAAVAPAFPLSWLRCARCGLIQVGEDIDDQRLFESYNYASSSVPGLVRHFDRYAESLGARFGSEQRIDLLEIGCNDGVLLRRLPSSWRRVGVDPSDVARRGRTPEDQYDLIAAPFGEALVEEHAWEEAFDVVTGSNCLAHISDLRSVFVAVRRALRSGGWFWIEVHDLVALLEGSQWDTIYHEHKVEWSVASLQECLRPLGFELHVLERLPLHGGLIRCGFRKEVPGPNGPSPGRASLDAPLARLADAYRKRLEMPSVQTLLRAQENGELIAAYGASGRANVFLNQIPKLRFSFLVDEAPLRMNRFIPVVGTPIVAPTALADRQPSRCLVTAWNYAKDIMGKNKHYSGEWLTAFPIR